MNRLSPHTVDRLAQVILAHLSQLDDSTIEKAVKENSWFTAFFIRQSQQALLPWFEGDHLLQFMKSYEAFPEKKGKRVGLILAGNIPWVGLHDVLMCWLSGNETFIKCSRQDRVLMEWLIAGVTAKIPEINAITYVVAQLPKLDFVMATGSNNSARYFRFHFQETPKLIRHNRYSIATLNSQTSNQEMAALAKDIFLYNGLGCRNVSNILVETGVDAEKCWKIWEDEIEAWLHPHYLEKIALERVNRQMIGKDFIERKGFLIQKSESIIAMPMGVINWIEVQDTEHANQILAMQQEQIQCVVGQDIPFGMSQKPQLADFADHVDSFELLNNL